MGGGGLETRGKGRPPKNYVKKQNSKSFQTRSHGSLIIISHDKEIILKKVKVSKIFENFDQIILCKL